MISALILMLQVPSVAGVAQQSSTAVMLDTAPPARPVNPLQIIKRNTRSLRAADSPEGGTAGPDATAETPASVACFYGLTTLVPGCPISGTSALPTGNSSTSIAVIDAYNDPNAQNDLNVFSQQFGLPQATIIVVQGGPTAPGADAYNGAWNLETSLDLQWAHAINPQASLFLVQATTQSQADMCTAIATAYNLGVDFVSISAAYGASATSWDSCFPSNIQTSPVTAPIYIASSGDTTFSINYPAASPSVIAAGGTSFVRNGTSLSEIFWDNQTGTGGGGGTVSTESRPGFQNPVQSVVGSQRGVPDISAIGFGVAVYDSNNYQGSIPYWTTLQGTSISAPILAANLSNAGRFGHGSGSALTTLYGSYGTSQYAQLFRDVVGNDSQCVAGYDLCTSLGTLIGNPVGGYTPRSLSFSDYYARTNTPAQSQNLTVTNNSNSGASITVTGAGVSADNGSSGAFSIVSNGCTGAPAPGGSCTVVVRRNAGIAVAQNTTKTFSATVVISTSGINTPLTTRVSVVGHG